MRHKFLTLGQNGHHFADDILKKFSCKKRFVFWFKFQRIYLTISFHDMRVKTSEGSLVFWDIDWVLLCGWYIFHAFCKMLNTPWYRGFCWFKPNMHSSALWLSSSDTERIALTTFWPPLKWRHNEHDGVSNHRRLNCLINRLFRRRSKHQTPRHWEFTSERWILRTKGQWRGKCFHLMASSWKFLLRCNSARSHERPQWYLM